MRILINFTPGVTFDYPTTIPVLKLMLLAAAGVPLVYMLAWFTRVRPWAPLLYIFAATAVTWLHLHRASSLLPAVTMAGWLLLGGVAVQDLFRRAARVTLPLYAATLLMLMAGTLLETGLGALRIASPLGSGAIVAAGCLWGAAALAGNYKDLWRGCDETLRRLQLTDWVLIGVMAAVVNLYLITALMPEMASDSFRAWLPMLKFYELNGGHVPHRWFDFSLYSPAFTDLLSVPYLLFGETGVRMFAVIMGLLFIGSIAAASRILTRSFTLGLATAMILFCLPMLHWIWYSAQHDCLAFAYCMGGLAILMRYALGADEAGKRPLSYLIIGALLLGFACAGKLTSFPITAAVMFTVLVFGLYDARQRGAGMMRVLLEMGLAGAAMLLIVLPYWGQTYHWTGDPLFPMFSVIQTVSNNSGGYKYFENPWCGTLVGWLLAPFNLTFNSSRIVDPYPNGSFGPWLWMFFPFLALAFQPKNRKLNFLVIITVISFTLTFMIKSYFVRYNFPQYALLTLIFSLCILTGLRLLVGSRPLPSGLAAVSTFALSGAALFLMLNYGFSVLFNFQNLNMFLKSDHGRQQVIENYWPGFSKVEVMTKTLPKDALVAVLRTEDEPISHLSRTAFEFRRDSIRFVSSSQDAQASMDLLESAKPTVIVTQNKYGGWPKDYGWRDAKRLILANRYCMFVTDDKLIDPHQEITIPRIASKGAATSDSLSWQDKSGGKGELEYSMEIPVPAGMTVVSAIVKSSVANMVFEFIGKDGSAIPIRAALEPFLEVEIPDIYTPNTALNPGQCFYYVRQGINPGTEKIRIRVSHDPDSDPPLVIGSLALFPASRFPVQIYAPVTPVKTLARTWDINPALVPDAWYRFGAEPPAANQDFSMGIPADSDHWLAWCFKPKPCDRILLSLDVSSSTGQDLALDLRVERGKELGQTVVSSERRQIPIQANRQIVTASWPCPKFDPASDTLSVIVWPEFKRDFRVMGGTLNLSADSMLEPKTTKPAALEVKK